MATPEFNLLLVHSPRRQDISDWEKVRTKILRKTDRIDVRITDNDGCDREIQAWQITRPSLVFSPMRLIEYVPKGGKVYAGRRYGKIEECEILRAAGLLTPPTLRLMPLMPGRIADWGDYVVVKPTTGAWGRSVRLVRRVDLDRRYLELTDNGQYEMMVQPFIEHVDRKGRPTTYRVMTLFGRPLYALISYWADARADVETLASSPAAIMASNDFRQKRIRQLFDDPEIVALAVRASSAFPDVPVLAFDILKETGTGALHVMEANPSGGSWHFSSDHNKRVYARALTRAMYAQYDVLETLAEELTARTLAEAMP